MRLKISLQALILALFQVTSVSAEHISQEEVDRQFVQNIVSHYLNCAGYFSALNKNSNIEEVQANNVDDAKLSRRIAMHFSLIASKYLDEEKPKVDEFVNSNLKNSYRKLLRLAGPNFQNIQELVDKYDDVCHLATHDPVEFIRDQQQELIQQYVSLN